MPSSAFTPVFLLLALAALATVPKGTVPQVHAALGDFAISASPSQLTLAQGATSSSTITVTAQAGYQGNATLQLAETYDSFDISVQFMPQVLELNSTHQTLSSIARISVSQGTLPGSYTIDVDAFDGIIQHSSQISLTVSGQDFSMSARTTRLDFPLAQNNTIDTSITVTSIGGFSGTVSLTTSVSSNYPPVPMLPFDSLNTNMLTVTPIASGSFLLAISVNSSMVAHEYFVDVGGVGATTAGVSRGFEMTVVVGPDFNMSMPTRNLIVHQGSIRVSTLALTSFNGYAGTISAYSGIISVNPPNPDIQLYPPDPSLSPGGTNSSLIVVKTDDRTGLGTYQVAIEATDDITGGYLTESLAYTITVEAPATGPDFTMYSNPALISGSLGTVVNSTINLIGVSGYNGPVSLYTSVGALARLNPASLTLSSTVNTSSTFSITLPSPTPGGGGPGWWYSSGVGTIIVIAADPTGLAHETSINITATPFTFVTSVARQQALPNSTSIIGLAVGAIGGFNGTVALAAVGSPGIVATVDYYPVLNFSILRGLFNSRLEVQVPAGASDGDYLVQVSATYMRPEHLPFSTAPKQALTYTLPIHVIVTSPNSSPTTILGLQPNEFYGMVAGLSAATAISAAYLVLRRRRQMGTGTSSGRS